MIERREERPAGLRPPQPGLGLLVARVALLLCLGLALGGAPLQRLAEGAGQPALAGILAVLLRAPAATLIWWAALLGLLGVVADLLLWAAQAPLHHLTVRRRAAGRIYLRVRLPLPEARGGAPDQRLGRELLARLHAALPAHGDGWAALTIAGAADEPATLGAVVAARALEQARAIAALRASIGGAAPDAVVEPADDPLGAALLPGRTLAWREFALRLPPHYPLLDADGARAGDTLGALIAALRPRGGVIRSEAQIVLRPLRGAQSRALTQGWRGHATALKLRLAARGDYALADDVRAIDAKLADVAFEATIRVVALAEGDLAAEEARALLAAAGDVLGAYQARTASRLQRLVPTYGGVRRLPAPGHTAGAEVAAVLARAPRAAPPLLLLPRLTRRGPSVLSAGEATGLWRLPDASLGALVRWLPCRQIPAPPHALAGDADRERIVLGHARRADGTLAPAGPALRDLRQVLHLTAGMGAGKSRLLANLCRQLIPHGFTLIDGKGDDRGGSLVATVRGLLPIADEGRLVLLDVLDHEWPLGLNPLAGSDLAMPGGRDMALGQVLATFARLDPETWGRAAGMQQYAQMATLLVLGAERQPTLAHVKQALLDEAYRARLLAGCGDSEVATFWRETFPRLGEAQRTSRDALLRRFDMLLTAETTRHLLTQPAPTLDLREAIEGGLIVLAPLPETALGGLAGAIGMLIFQAFVRAALARDGSDQSRASYPLIVDELQVLLGGADTRDVETAITRLRSLGIPAIYAHQALAQLGSLRDLMLINAANRVILQTQEPDASAYARLYAASLTPGDISRQDPAEHQYAAIRCDGRQAGPFSIRPLPWPEPVEEAAPAYAGPDWRLVLPAERDEADPFIIQLVYGAPDERRAVAGLAQLGEDEWARLIARWDAIRRVQRRHILRNPGCIPDRMERQRWLSRLLAARPRILAAAEFARARGGNASAPRML